MHDQQLYLVAYRVGYTNLMKILTDSIFCFENHSRVSWPANYVA